VAEQIDGVAHIPDSTPRGLVMLTHGAGGNRDGALLVALCDEWAARGWLAIRYNLPYRRRRPKGPPSGSATADAAGVAEAVAAAHTLTDGPVIAGGHSYGGRMTSLVAADGADLDVLALTSYPLHPPGKPQRLRTEHLPAIAVPTVFTQGSSDPFGSIEELRAAAALVDAPTRIVEIAGARHDLVPKRPRSGPRDAPLPDVPVLAVDAALGLLSRP
jgi:predicted alpha/beta-hydrolase family hydrolase